MFPLSQGKEVIEYFINQLHEDGITHIPPWVGPAATETTPATASSSTTGAGEHDEPRRDSLQLPRGQTKVVGAEGGAEAETEEEEYSMSSSSLMLGASATNIATTGSSTDASEDSAAAAEGNQHRGTPPPGNLVKTSCKVYSRKQSMRKQAFSKSRHIHLLPLEFDWVPLLLCLCYSHVIFILASLVLFMAYANLLNLFKSSVLTVLHNSIHDP
jgi:hypothetical protein